MILGIKMILKTNPKTPPIILIATPYARYDNLQNKVQVLLQNYVFHRIKTPEELNLNNLQIINPEFIFFPHWSWIIPKDIYDTFECIIFHMTDLPYGRGGSPLQNLIIRGYKETKLSAIKCNGRLDAGPVYCKRPLSLSGSAEEIFNRASHLMEEMIVQIIQERINPVEQDGEIVVFKRRNPKDGNITNLTTLDQVFDYIRMLDAEEYPHAFMETDSFHFEFSNVHKNDNLLEAKVVIREKNRD